MRPSNKRSRSKSNRPRPLGNIVNRVFDSSGPEGKVRGTPQQIIDKYLVLARDAQLSNDRVAAENFLQHAEHYTRMLGEAQRELAREAESRNQQHGQQQRRSDEEESDGERRSEGRDENRRDDNRRDESRRDESRRDDNRPRRDHDRPRPQPERETVEAEGPSTLVETPESRLDAPQAEPDPAAEAQRPRNRRAPRRKPAGAEDAPASRDAAE